MSVFRRFLRGPARGEKGMSIMTAMVVLAVGGLSVLLIQLYTNYLKATKRKVQQQRFSITTVSGVETMLVAYRLAEIRYNDSLGDCTSGTGRPFFRALKEGHGCTAGVGTIGVFGSSDTAGASNENHYSYSHPGGCTIRASTGLRCDGNPPPVEVITLGHHPDAGTAMVQEIHDSKMRFTLAAVLPAKQIVEFKMSHQPKKGSLTERTFAIRATLTNSAHMEFDGRVTQQHPNPLSRCPGKPWATYRLYQESSSSCEEFVRIGGGSGLAYYDERYFGFRPADGFVVDLKDAGAGASYFVDPSTGATCGSCARVFPSYAPSTLRNADDITLIEDQIFYVAGQADSAHIGVVSAAGTARPEPQEVPPAPPGSATRIPLCPLGKLGWGQAYRGIAATAWSDALLPTVDDPDRPRIATFLLKTDTGTLLTVTNRTGKGSAPTGPGCLEFKFAGDDYWSCCSAFKDESLQEIEYVRTFGFDRTADGKAYYIY